MVIIHIFYFIKFAIIYPQFWDFIGTVQYAHGSHPHDGPKIFNDLVSPEFAHLAGKTMGQLVAAETYAMVTTLTHQHRPVRQFEVDAIDELSMGALMMHFMLETIIIGRLLGVNPFDQPAVEEGKQLAKKYLQEP